MKTRRTAWQKRTGLKGIGPLKEGLLKKVGYSVSASKTRRHAAVKRAVKKYGKTSTIRKLNAVAVYTRKSSPAKSRAFRSDMKFAQKMKGGNEEKLKKIEKVKDRADDMMLEGVPEDKGGIPTAPLRRQAAKAGITVGPDAGPADIKNAAKDAHRKEMNQPY